MLVLSAFKNVANYNYVHSIVIYNVYTLYKCIKYNTTGRYIHSQ